MDLIPSYYYLIIFGAGFLASLIFTPIMRKLALSKGWVAVPKDSRWHKKETALLGGVGIFAATFITWGIASSMLSWETFRSLCLPLILCGSGIFTLGLLDDILTLLPQHKLVGQIVIAAILIFFGFRLEWSDSETLNLLISMIWVVGITNAFNLLDNMDGLSAGIALISGAGLFFVAYFQHGATGSSATILILTAPFLGALLGFLIYNFNPASIFMGDAVSLFIGFTLASLTMLGTSAQEGRGSVHVLSVIAIPILILFIPILDTFFVSFMRKLFRRPISQGGRDHSSHRMVAIGFSERRAVVILYGFSLLSGLIALSLPYVSAGIAVVALVLYLLFILFFWIYLGRVKVYPEESIFTGDQGRGLTPVLVEITYKRRLFEIALDFLLVTVAYYAAYLLRFEGDLGPDFVIFIRSLPIVIACQIVAFYLMGIYRGVWASTGVRDLIDYFKAVTLATVVSMLILLFLYRFQSVSRAVFVIYFGIMLILVSLSRLSFRILEEGVKRGRRPGRRTLIYGAGMGGQIVLKEIEQNAVLGLSMVGFLDDDTHLAKRKIKGYPVLGDDRNLKALIEEHSVEDIIISFRKNGTEKTNEVRKEVARAGLNVKVRQMHLVFK